MSFASKLGAAYPRIAHVTKRIDAPTQTLSELRSTLWGNRLEFWARKAGRVGEQWQGAKTEARELLPRLKTPGSATYREVGTAAVWGVQIFGAFCIGEMVGRGNIIGYKVGDAGHH